MPLAAVARVMRSPQAAYLRLHVGFGGSPVQVYLVRFREYLVEK